MTCCCFTPLLPPPPPRSLSRARANDASMVFFTYFMEIRQFKLSIAATTKINFPFSRTYQCGEHFLGKSYRIDEPLLVLSNPMIYPFFSKYICLINWYPHVLPIIRKTRVNAPSVSETSSTIDRTKNKSSLFHPSTPHARTTSFSHKRVSVINNPTLVRESRVLNIL